MSDDNFSRPPSVNEARDYVRAIRECRHQDDLRALVAEIRTLPEGDRIPLRPLLAARNEAFRVAAEAPAVAPAPAPAPAKIGFVAPPAVAAVDVTAFANLAAALAPVGERLVSVGMPSASAAVVAPLSIENRRALGIRSERAPRGAVVAPAASQASARNALSRGALIAGAVAAGRGRLFSWAGSKIVTRGRLGEALEAIGRKGDLPAAKSAHAQAGRAVGALGGHGYDTRAVRQPKRDEPAWPEGVAARWIVGQVGASLTSAEANQGRAYGRVALVVDLRADGTLCCAGDLDLARRVHDDFDRRVAAEEYASADVTFWLARKLREAHYGVSYGVTIYVPAGEADRAKALVDAVSAIWGASWMKGLPVASEGELLDGIGEGLAAEVAAVARALVEAREEARELAAAKVDRERAEGKGPLAGDTDGQRWEARREAAKLGAQIGPRKAASILRDLQDADERVQGFAAFLGEDKVSAVKSEIARLRGEVEPLVSDGAKRAAVLEID